MSVSIRSFKSAVVALEAATNEIKNDLVRDATIQRFEFCIELSWKCSKKVMGTMTSAPRQVVREMGQNALISDVPLWLKAIEYRNLSVHTYNEELADKVYDFILEFLPELKKLISELEK